MWQDVLKVRTVWSGDKDSFTFSDKRALYFVWNFFQEDINKTDSFFRDNYFTHKQFSSWDIDEDSPEFRQYIYSYSTTVNRLKEEFYKVRTKILSKTMDNITEEEQIDLMMGSHDYVSGFTHVKMSKERLYELYNNTKNNQTMDDKREVTKIKGKPVLTGLKYNMYYIQNQLVDLAKYVSKRNYRESKYDLGERDHIPSNLREIEKKYKLHLMKRYG